MTLDENDGSDMDLDSDTSPEMYQSSTVTTYKQCSKPPPSQGSKDNKDGLNQSLDKDKKGGSPSCSPQRSGNDSLQPSSNGKAHTENVMNPLPEQSSSPSMPETTVSRPQQLMNGLPLKTFMTRVNVNNGPTPLKRQKIKFELKSTGYKHKLISHVDRQSVNFITSMTNTPSEVKKDRNNPPIIGSEIFIMRKPPSSLTTVTKFSYNGAGKREGPILSTVQRDDKDNQVIGPHPKSQSPIIEEKEPKQNVTEGLSLVKKNSVAEGKGNNQQQEKFVENPTKGLDIEDPGEKEKDLNQKVVDDDSSKLDVETVETSVTAEKGNDKLQIVDDRSVILEQLQDQGKTQVDHDDNFRVKVQEHQTSKFGQMQVNHQNTEVPLAIVDSNKIKEALDNGTENKSADITMANNNVKNVPQVMDVDNDDNKDSKHLDKTTTHRNDLAELDHQKNDEHSPSKTDMMEDNTSSEDESDCSKTNSAQDTVKVKNKKAANVVKPTKCKAIETGSQEVANQVHESVRHLDHLTDLMTKLTNQIYQQNKHDGTESQTQPINHMTQSTSPTVQPVKQATQYTKPDTSPINQVLSKRLNQSNGQVNQQITQPTQSTSQASQPIKKEEETINTAELSDEVIEKYRKLDNTLSEFDEIARKAVNAYIELNKLLPEGTIIKIDPPTTYKWDIITSMFGINDLNKIEIDHSVPDTEDRKGKKKDDGIDMENGSNGSNVAEETSSETEFDDEDLDILSDDPDDKSFKCRSTILRQPNPKRWHNTRSNRPPSANLRQRTKVDPYSISTTPITPNSSSKKKQIQAAPKRTLRTRKGDHEDDYSTTTTPHTPIYSDSDKFYEDGRPRRPGNGFSYFCGDMCAKVRNEKLPISGTIAYAAEIWKKMTEEEKKPWLDRGAKSKIEYQELINRWKEQQEEHNSNSSRKRTVSPNVKSGSSSKKPRND